MRALEPKQHLVLVAYYYYGEDGNRYIGGTMCSYETKGG